MVGPAREQVWKQFASETGGFYIGGGGWKPDRVNITYKGWKMVLDIGEVLGDRDTRKITRMRVPVVSRDRFRFEIRRQGVQTAAERGFGMFDLLVGDEEFDERFLITGNNAAKLREFFADEHVRAVFTKYSGVGVKILDDEGMFGSKYPENVDALYFEAPGTIEDMLVLRAVYAVFCRTLDRLFEIRSIEAEGPPLELS
ncbi:hypothetical protein HZA57_10055 [Candidatus Poribacteria bacterium]|nr:hypothetical protein [Candidatus Poribacteria bacterium]